MSNFARLRYQRATGDSRAHYPITYYEVSSSEELAAILRVATASGLVPGPRSEPDKQETPEVGASEGLYQPHLGPIEEHGGCSQERKR